MDLTEVSKKMQFVLLSQALADNLQHRADTDLDALCGALHTEMDHRGMIDRED